MYFRLTGTTVRLAWVIEIEQTDALHWWLVTVDAKSGEVLEPASALLRPPYGLCTGAMKPPRQDGCVSNASVAVFRPVPVDTAL